MNKEERKYIGNVCKYCFNYDSYKVLIFHKNMNHYEEGYHIRPTSAGFLRFYINKNNELAVYCYGESVSLKLKAGLDDSEIISRLIGIQ
jgi:hypothetical protein